MLIVAQIPHILWNPTVHYRVHKVPPLVAMLSQMSPACPSCFFEVSFNNILPSKFRYSKRSVASRFFNRTLCSLMSHTCHLPHPLYTSWVRHANNVWRGIQITILFIMQIPDHNRRAPKVGTEGLQPSPLSPRPWNRNKNAYFVETMKLKRFTWFSRNKPLKLADDYCFGILKEKINKVLRQVLD
jgi:hypothetical protein